MDRESLIRRLRIAFMGIFLCSRLALGGAVVLTASPLSVEGELEAKLERKLKAVLGPTTRIGVSVVLHTKERPGAPASAPKKGPGWNPVGPSEAVSLRTLEVESADVTLQIPAKMSDGQIFAAKAIVTDSLAQFTPKVSVKKYDIEDEAAPPAAAAAASPTESQSSSNGARTQRNAQVLQLISFLGIAAALLFGLVFLAWALRSGFKLVSKQLSAGGETRSAPMAAPPPAAATAPVTGRSEARGSSDDKSEKTAAPLQFLARNLKVIKQCLKEQPSFLVREISNMNGSGQGVRWLFLLLTAEEQASLQTYLGEDRLAKLSSDAIASERESSFETKSNWLDELTERVSLKRVQGSSPIEAALNSETIVAFLLADGNSLISAAEAVNNKPGWRILAEFLPREEFQRYLAKSDAPKWKSIIDATELDSAQIQSSAKAMLESIKNSPGNKSKKSDQARYFQSTLIDPVVSALSKMSLGQQDELIRKIQKSAGDLLPMIESRIWTPRQLQRVPPEYLAEFVKALPMEHRVALVLGLPPDLADKIIEVLPEGTIKIVVQDQVKRIEAKGDERERAQYTEICRGLLQLLREKAINREFRLLRPDEVDDVSSAQSEEFDAAEKEAA